jgi:hypothetical protein
MNRILHADVILTLTAEQARELVFELEYPDSQVLSMGTVAVIVEQCVKQGVSL